MTGVLLLALIAGLPQEVNRIPGQPFALEVPGARTVVYGPRGPRPSRDPYYGQPTVAQERVVPPPKPDTINAGSSLQRVVFTVNFDDSPVRVTDASADFISLAEVETECLPGADRGRGFLERLFTVKPDCGSYAGTFLQSFTAETFASSEVAAVEVRFITLDYFGDFMRDVRVRRKTDYSGVARWNDALANHDDIYEHLTTIVFVNRVTLLDGSFWSADVGAVNRIVLSLNMNVDLEELEQAEPDMPVPIVGSFGEDAVIGLLQDVHGRGDFLRSNNGG